MTIDNKFLYDNDILTPPQKAVHLAKNLAGRVSRFGLYAAAGLSLLACDVTNVNHYDGSGGSGNPTGGPYTCESFAQMFVDDCCPKFEDPDECVYNPKKNESTYSAWVEECSSPLEKGISLNKFNPMFYCVENECSGKAHGEELESNVRDCINNNWPEQ